MRLLFNAAVIPSPGKYEYIALSVEQAVKWLKEGYDLSFIGCPATADFIEKISGKGLNYPAKSSTCNLVMKP